MTIVAHANGRIEGRWTPAPLPPIPRHRPGLLDSASVLVLDDVIPDVTATGFDADPWRGFYSGPLGVPYDPRDGL